MADRKPLACYCAYHERAPSRLAPPRYTTLRDVTSPGRQHDLFWASPGARRIRKEPILLESALHRAGWLLAPHLDGEARMSNPAA
jgi:hypothetical protein